MFLYHILAMFISTLLVHDFIMFLCYVCPLCAYLVHCFTLHFAAYAHPAYGHFELHFEPL
ncbi:hypothetical protein HanIR_Chr17g0874971 [Helianthus annuus]|nr:hypothetical protein HanIR_Chr17g0874971 [Helianthus annuus]